MSYCQPQHVSDFSYQRAQNFLESNPPKPFAVASATSASAAVRTQSFVVRGHLAADGSWQIRQAIASALPVEDVISGEYSAEIIDAQGVSQTAPLRFWQIDHSEGITNRHFSISVGPIEGQILKIRHNGQLIFEGPLPP
jgi:hypothetical protein